MLQKFTWLSPVLSILGVTFVEEQVSATFMLTELQDSLLSCTLTGFVAFTTDLMFNHVYNFGGQVL
jgi:hypothetical protein